MRLASNELALARDAEDWTTLWKAAMPWVKFVISSMARQGVDEDLLQEGNLAAGAAVRSWDPDKGAFSTHICSYVRFEMLKHLNEQKAHGTGTRWLAESGQPVELVPVEAEGEEDAEPQELTYADTGHTPEGFGDPGIELQRQTAIETLQKLLATLAPEDAANLSDFYGVIASTTAERAPQDPSTVREWARKKGLPLGTAHRLISAAKRKLEQSRNSRYIPPTGHTTLEGPTGRSAHRTHAWADRHPGFWNGLVGVMGDVSAWRESTGKVWNDWSYRPKAARQQLEKEIKARREHEKAAGTKSVCPSRLHADVAAEAP